MFKFHWLYNYTMIIILVLIELFHGAQFVVMTKGVGKRMQAKITGRVSRKVLIINSLLLATKGSLPSSFSFPTFVGEEGTTNSNEAFQKLQFLDVARRKTLFVLVLFCVQFCDGSKLKPQKRNRVPVVNDDRQRNDLSERVQNFHNL